MTYYLAIDIGASSGRHMLAHIEHGLLVLEEMYRFPNEAHWSDGHLVWNIEALFEHIKTGIKKCVQANKIPVSVGIDTWAVDYVLLDAQKEVLQNAFCYRDDRCAIGVQAVHECINEADLYKESGIQFQRFNTIYQLKSDDVHQKASALLMIPDYFHYRLTGKITHEYTNCSTTQLLHLDGSLDVERCHTLGIDSSLFTPIYMPSTIIGEFQDSIRKELGCNCKVVLPASHDTGSAFMASMCEDAIIISSGTWSLLGIETMQPYVNEASYQANFTNEGGYDHRYRFLKNIMGLWIIQCVARELKAYSFAQLVEEARLHPYPHTFSVDDERFLHPTNMIKEIQAALQEQGYKPPVAPGELAYCVYHSLAYSYHQAILELEAITKKRYDCINIIGGGCQNALLNEMIAQLTKKKVIAGPVEATALGNIAAQLIAEQQVNSLQEARALIKASFDIKEYEGEQYE